MDPLTDLLNHQDGVISRRQVEACGGTAADIARRLRRREWVRLLPGVYVDHTGTPTWRQRAWAGVLFHAPAVVADESVLAAPPDRIVIAVERTRSVSARPGYEIRWVSGLDQQSLLVASPPRMRIEDAALRVAARAPREIDAVQVLASAVQRRSTTAQRLEDALERHPRLPRRGWLQEVIADVGTGSHSVLEREYAVRVERAHGLPPSSRQCRSPGERVRYADATYPDHGLEVELDGRLFHDSPRQRHHDLERDLDAVVAGRVTVRLGWGQVLDGACATAARVALLLQERGWAGRPVPCSPGCPVRAPGVRAG